MFSSQKSGQAPGSAPALSFKERLQMQLNKAKEIQKMAQIDLDNSKKDILADQNKSQLSSSTLISSSLPPTSTFRSSSISSTSTSEIKTENKFESLRQRLQSQIQSQKMELSNSSSILSASTSSSSTQSDTLKDLQNKENKENIKTDGQSKIFPNEQFNKKIDEVKQEKITPQSLSVQGVKVEKLQEVIKEAPKKEEIIHKEVSKEIEKQIESVVAHQVKPIQQIQISQKIEDCLIIEDHFKNLPKIEIETTTVQSNTICRPSEEQIEESNSNSFTANQNSIVFISQQTPPPVDQSISQIINSDISKQIQFCSLPIQGPNSTKELISKIDQNQIIEEKTLTNSCLENNQNNIPVQQQNENQINQQKENISVEVIPQKEIKKLEFHHSIKKQDGNNSENCKNIQPISEETLKIEQTQKENVFEMNNYIPLIQENSIKSELPSEWNAQVINNQSTQIEEETTKVEQHVKEQIQQPECEMVVEDIKAEVSQNTQKYYSTQKINIQEMEIESIKEKEEVLRVQQVSISDKTEENDLIQVIVPSAVVATELAVKQTKQEQSQQICSQNIDQIVHSNDQLQNNNSGEFKSDEVQANILENQTQDSWKINQEKQQHYHASINEISSLKGSEVEIKRIESEYIQDPQEENQTNSLKQQMSMTNEVQSIPFCEQSPIATDREDEASKSDIFSIPYCQDSPIKENENQIQTIVEEQEQVEVKNEKNEKLQESSKKCQSNIEFIQNNQPFFIGATINSPSFEDQKSLLIEDDVSKNDIESIPFCEQSSSRENTIEQEDQIDENAISKEDCQIVQLSQEIQQFNSEVARKQQAILIENETYPAKDSFQSAIQQKYQGQGVDKIDILPIPACEYSPDKEEEAQQKLLQKQEEERHQQQLLFFQQQYEQELRQKQLQQKQEEEEEELRQKQLILLKQQQEEELKQQQQLQKQKEEEERRQKQQQLLKQQQEEEERRQQQKLLEEEEELRQKQLFLLKQQEEEVLRQQQKQQEEEQRQKQILLLKQQHEEELRQQQQLLLKQQEEEERRLKEQQLLKQQQEEEERRQQQKLLEEKELRQQQLLLLKQQQEEELRQQQKQQEEERRLKQQQLLIQKQEEEERRQQQKLFEEEELRQKQILFLKQQQEEEELRQKQQKEEELRQQLLLLQKQQEEELRQKQEEEEFRQKQLLLLKQKHEEEMRQKQLLLLKQQQEEELRQRQKQQEEEELRQKQLLLLKQQQEEDEIRQKQLLLLKEQEEEEEIRQQQLLLLKQKKEEELRQKQLQQEEELRQRQKQQEEEDLRQKQLLLLKQQQEEEIRQKQLLLLKQQQEEEIRQRQKQQEEEELRQKQLLLQRQKQEEELRQQQLLLQKQQEEEEEERRQNELQLLKQQQQEEVRRQKQLLLLKQQQEEEDRRQQQKQQEEEELRQKQLQLQKQLQEQEELRLQQQQLEQQQEEEQRLKQQQLLFLQQQQQQEEEKFKQQQEQEHKKQEEKLRQQLLLEQEELHLSQLREQEKQKIKYEQQQLQEQQEKFLREQQSQQNEETIVREEKETNQNMIAIEDSPLQQKEIQDRDDKVITSCNFQSSSNQDKSEMLPILPINQCEIKPIEEDEVENKSQILIIEDESINEQNESKSLQQINQSFSEIQQDCQQPQQKENGEEKEEEEVIVLEEDEDEQQQEDNQNNEEDDDSPQLLTVNDVEEYESQNYESKSNQQNIEILSQSNQEQEEDQLVAEKDNSEDQQCPQENSYQEQLQVEENSKSLEQYEQISKEENNEIEIQSCSQDIQREEEEEITIKSSIQDKEGEDLDNLENNQEQEQELDRREEVEINDSNKTFEENIQNDLPSINNLNEEQDKEEQAINGNIVENPLFNEQKEKKIEDIELVDVEGEDQEQTINNLKNKESQSSNIEFLGQKDQQNIVVIEENEQENSDADASPIQGDIILVSNEKYELPRIANEKSLSLSLESSTEIKLPCQLKEDQFQVNKQVCFIKQQEIPNKTKEQQELNLDQKNKKQISTSPIESILFKDQSPQNQEINEDFFLSTKPSDVQIEKSYEADDMNDNSDSILNQINSFIMQKSKVESNLSDQIKSSPENIFERIKKQSDSKQGSLLELIIKEGTIQSPSSANRITPNNTKIPSCEAANQFSNGSFGITPKKIEFLTSTQKKDDESEEIKKSKKKGEKKKNDFHELIQISSKQSSISQGYHSSKMNQSPNLKNNSASPSLKNKSPRRSVDQKLRSKSKSPNRNQPEKQVNDKVRERKDSRERSRSPIAQKKSANKSVGRDDLSLSSVNLSRFDLTPTQEEVDEERKLQEQDLQQELARIAQILSIQKYNKNQIQFVESVYGERFNVCKLMLNQSGKNILYQTLALMEDTIPKYFIVVVTNQFLTLRQKLNKQVSWACINSLMGVDVLVQVQHLLMEKKVKLLFVQIEQLQQDQLRFMKNQIKMIIYEDIPEKTIEEVNKSYDISCYHLFQTQGFKTHEQISDTCKRLHLKNLDEQVQLFGFDFSHIHWSFESDKEKSFLNFIRKNNLKKVLFFVDSSKKLEEVVSSFNQKGMKMTAFTQQKQDQLSQLFQKDQFEILCLHSGTVVPKSIKQIAQYYIHYQLPRNILNYLSDINGFQFYHLQGRGIQFDKFSCGFLSDQDFFDIRSAMIQELTDKKLIQTIIKVLNMQGGHNSEQTHSGKKKENQTQISDDFFFNVVPDETEKKIQDHYDNLMITNKNLFDEQKEEENTKQIQITKFTTENCIKKEALIRILSYIAADKVTIMPFTCQVQSVQKSLLMNNSIISSILKGKSSATFNILETAQGLQMTSQELHKLLKKLQGEKKIQYDVKEEIALLTLKSNLDSILDKLFEEIRFQEEKQINELDTMYISARLTCNFTLDQVFKYQKYKEVTSKGQLQISEEVSTVSLKTILEKYLSSSSGKKMCSIFSLSEKNRLPFISLKSQREKSNLLKDIQILLPRITKSKLNIPEFQLNHFVEEADVDSQARFIAMILQGIDGKYINEFKPALQYKKYFKYDYFDIHQIATEYLQNHYTQLIQTATTKKIKI